MVILSDVSFFYLGRDKRNVKKGNVTFVEKKQMRALHNLGADQSGKERLVKKDDHDEDHDTIEVKKQNKTSLSNFSGTL